MTTVSVEYHRELDKWWADSSDVPGWIAAGDSLEEVRQLVVEGLPFYLEDDSVEILESMAGAPVVVVTMTTASEFGSAGGVSLAPVFVGGSARLTLTA